MKLMYIDQKLFLRKVRRGGGIFRLSCKHSFIALFYVKTEIIRDISSSIGRKQREAVLGFNRLKGDSNDLRKYGWEGQVGM